MSFAVAILGHPNVGKSTLFNRLVGRRLALVDNTPGVTRDRRVGEGRIADLTFRVVDTAGLEEAAPGSLAGRTETPAAAAPPEGNPAAAIDAPIDSAVIGTEKDTQLTAALDYLRQAAAKAAVPPRG